MNRSVLRSFGVVLASATIALSPLVARAQDAQISGLGVEDVRATFLERGYQVEPPLNWWTNDHVTTFRVYPTSDQFDPAAPVLMVLVYPDLATAHSERTAAEAREPGREMNVSAISGPHLVPGYGPSAWFRNVAMVATTVQELRRRYADEQARDMPMDAASQIMVESTPAPVAYTVESAYLGLLIDRAQANL